MIQCFYRKASGWFTVGDEATEYGRDAKAFYVVKWLTLLPTDAREEVRIQAGADNVRHTHLFTVSCTYE